jgi:streptogramin lyase
MSYLSSLSNVLQTTVSASNQIFNGLISVDSNNISILSNDSTWSTISPKYVYYPKQAMAIDGTSFDTAIGVQLDTNNNMYVSGTYSNTAPTIYNSNAISSGLTLPTNCNISSYLVKYDPTGVASWTAAIDGTGNDLVNSMDLDTSGNILLAGSYDTVSPIIYNSGNTISTNTVSFPSPNGNTSAYIVKYDSSGTAIWNTAIDSTNTDSANAITSDISDNVIVAGSYVPVSTPLNIVQTFVSTFAGSGTSSYGDGIGINTGFSGPQGIVIDSVGNMYVTDTVTHRIRKITSAGVVTTFVGSGTATYLNGTGTNASLRNPSGIALDSVGNLYVADYSGHISKITSEGVVTTFASGFANPRGVTVDSSGNVYVGGTGNNNIYKITSDGIVTVLAGSGVKSYKDGTGTNASFWYPYGVAVDSAGNVYVADQVNNRIRKITSSGVVTTFAGSGAVSYADGIGTNAGLYAPIGITIDSSDNLYISDTANNRIRKITSTGVVTTLAGGSSGTTGTFADATGTNAGFNSPDGIALDSNGKIYVVEMNNNRIRKLVTVAVNTADPNTVTTLAGSGTLTKSDGLGTNAGLRQPMGVTVDTNNNVYVAEYGSNTVRKITSAGVVTTFAGSGAQSYADGIGTNASFNSLYGICVDYYGNLYIGDRDNHAIRKITPDGTVSTLAGSGITGSSNGIGTNASFNLPYGVCIDSNNNIYVADQGNNLIRKIDNTGTVTTLAGSGIATFLDATGTNAGFKNPQGVAVDSLGNVYVGDTPNNRIRKITSDGVVTTFAGSGTATYLDGTGTNARFFYPKGVTIDLNNNLYVADYANNRIRKITSDAVVTTIAGSGTATFTEGIGTNASFNIPWGITVDLSGNLYVGDYQNNRIRKITPPIISPTIYDSTTVVNTSAAYPISTIGEVSTIAGSGTATYLDGIGTNAGFNNPRALAFDSVGNIYVADFSNHRIRKITSDGIVTIFAGSGTATFLDGTGTNAGFNQPLGIAVDSVGNVYVADYTNQRIRKITSDGVVTTLAGGLYGTTGTFADGIGTNACFNNPRELAVDSIGNIYVADQTNHRIRKITSAGVVTTFAGSGIGSYGDGTGTNSGLNNPFCVDIDLFGNLYVGDISNRRIRKITSTGVVTTLAGSGFTGSTDGVGTNASFNNPYGTAVDLLGNVYVADTNNNCIRKITSAGVVTTLVGGLSGTTGTFVDGIGTNAGFYYPYGVTVDLIGNVYVADTYNNRIRRIETLGSSIEKFAGGGSGDGIADYAGFGYVNGVTADTIGNVYVADSTGNRIRKITSAGVVTTFAGSGTSTWLDGIGTNAGFSGPIAIAIDQSGNFYITDQSNHRIRKITSSGVVSTLAGSGTASFGDGTGTNTGFNAPRGIAVDSSGNVYVGDCTNNRIRKITSAGVVTTLAGSGTATFLDATGTNAGFINLAGVAIDSNGNLYIGGYSDNRIRKITSAGVVTTLAGSGVGGSIDGIGTNTGFNAPQGVCIDSYNNIYVADSGNNRIRKVTQSGVVSTVASTLLNGPTGVTVDPFGNIYIADWSNYRVRKVSAPVSVSTFAGSGSVSYADGIGVYAGFNASRGVVVDLTGNMYIADTQNHRIRKITSTGVVTTLAGSGTASFGDGIGTNTGFNQPFGLAVDLNGNVYVADTFNHRIRKIDTTGVVTTFAGSGSQSYGDGIGTNSGFNLLTGVSIDSTGNIYVADMNNQRIRKVTPTRVVTTIAGSGSQSYGDGIGTNSGFNNPNGLVVDSSGIVYVADYTNHRIRKIDITGVVTTFAGSGTSTFLDGIGTNAGFKNPFAIEVDYTGNIYIGDQGNNRIRKITSAGVVTTIAGGSSGTTATFADGIGTNSGFNAPCGLSFDSLGNMYVVDMTNNRIRKITFPYLQGITKSIIPSPTITLPTGGVSNTAAFAIKYNSFGVSQWFSVLDGTSNDSATSVTTDSSGNVFMSGIYGSAQPTLYSGYNTGLVSTLAGSGTATWLDGIGTNASFRTPAGLAIDSFGNVYVTEYGNHRIRKITSAGVVTTFAGSGTGTYLDATGTNAGFNTPAGVAIDSSGNMYIADYGNNRIRKIDTSGVVTTFAGSGAVSYADGIGTNSGFWGPRGIAVDSVGNVYVGDTTTRRIRKITSDGVVTTLAGSGAATFLDGIGLNAAFWYPYGLAVDSAGNVYVADQSNNRIRKITSAGVVTTLAGSGTATYLDGTGTNAGLNNPLGITIDSTGNLYVTDTGNNRIRKITSTGVVTTLSGGRSGTTGIFADGIGTNSGFNNPYGIAIDSIGNLYIGDYANNRIRKIVNSTLYANDTLYTVTTFAGSGTGTFLDATGTNAGFKAPRGVAVDLTGNMYIADTQNHCIRKITSTGVVTTFAGSGTATFLDGTGTSAGFNAPANVAIDTLGNVYVADQTNNRIRKITSAGVVTTFAGSGTATYLDATGTSAGFSAPTGVAVDSIGNLYVADYINNRIRKITSSGVVTTLAGGGSGDATGTSAGFNRPYGVAVDSTGNMYVSDALSNRIRKITSAGVVTTLAGSGSGASGSIDGIGSNASFNYPLGVAIDYVGNIYVGDSTNNLIRKITSAGVVTTLAGSGTATYVEGIGTNAGFNTPTGVAVDLSGNLYVSDISNNRIRKITPQLASPLPVSNNTGFGLKLDSSGNSQWLVTANPIINQQDICSTIDPSGNFYLAGCYGTDTATIYNANNLTSPITLPSVSSNAAFLVKYNPTGQAQWTGVIENANPYSLVTDSSNNVYMSGSYIGTTSPNIYGSNNIITHNVSLPYPTRNTGINNSSFVIKYDSNGTPTNTLALNGSSNNIPFSIAVDLVGSNIAIAGIYKGPTTIYDGNNFISSTVFPSALTTQAGYVINYSLAPAVFSLPSSNLLYDNGTQKYVSNSGDSNVTLNITNSNNSTVLSTYTISPNANNSIFQFYNGNWYKFV